MSRTQAKAESRGCVKAGGREYVNVTVCAARLGIARQTLTKQIKAGRYSRVTLEGYKGEWFDWEQTRAAFNRYRSKQSHVHGGRRGKKDSQVFNGQRPVSDPTIPIVPEVGGDVVSDPSMPKDDEPNILSYFDPEDPQNMDCWETDDAGGFLMIPGTDPPRHYVDWKKAQDKGMANIRYQQYMKQKGDLIPKTEVVQMLSRIFPPVTAIIMQMPDKYASRINGRVEEMIGRPMTNVEVTLLKSILQDEAEKLCHNLQDAVEEATSEDD